jgi:hypothetical protein
LIDQTRYIPDRGRFVSRIAQPLASRCRSAPRVVPHNNFEGGMRKKRVTSAAIHTFP